MIARKKGILVINDGVGDRPLAIFGNRTPLEAGEFETFKRLAREGVTGLMDPLSPGIRVGTDVGHLALFGYNPLKTYWGRGPIEAAGVNIALEPGDIAFRCNFATIDPAGSGGTWIVTNRRAGRIREGTEELAKAVSAIRLDADTQIIFRPGTEHRAVLVFSNRNLSAEVTASDPGEGHEGEPVRIVEPRKKGFKMAERTAELLNEFTRKSYEVLSHHPVNLKRIREGKPPANIVLIRGAGMQTKMRSITERFNIFGACITGESTIMGIARIAGFSVLAAPEFTANVDTDIEKKCTFVLEGLENHDLVVVHFKGPDICGHDGKPEEKRLFLEREDRALGKVLEEVSKRRDCYIALTGDHSTPCEIGEHTADPVPCVVWGRGVLTDEVTSYGERSCQRGGLGRITANQFLLTLLDLMDVTFRFGT